MTTKRNLYFLFLFSLGLYKPLLCWVSIFAETLWAYATLPLCLEVLILIILSQRAYTFIFMFILLFVGGSLDYQKESLLFILIFTRSLQATVMLSLKFCWDFMSLCDYTSVPWGFNTYYPEPESLYLYFYVYIIIRGKYNSWLPLEEVNKLCCGRQVLYVVSSFSFKLPPLFLLVSLSLYIPFICLGALNIFNCSCSLLWHCYYCSFLPSLGC